MNVNLRARGDGDASPFAAFGVSSISTIGKDQGKARRDQSKNMYAELPGANSPWAAR